MPQSNLRLVFIEWTDAHSSDEWISTQEALEQTPHVIHTVGWVLHEDKDKIIVAMQKDIAHDSVSMTITIPKPWILKIKTIKN